MKPAVSAMNDWLKTLIVHKSFHYLPISKDGPHYASIELGSWQQYDYVTNNYVDKNVVKLELCVNENDGKLTNVVALRIKTPTGLIEGANSYYSKIQTFQNITVKNLIEFVDFFREMFRFAGKESLCALYNIPNHNNMGFVNDYKPFKGTFEQYFKDHQKEYNKFLEYREILFNFLERCSKINTKKKLIKNISKKEK